MLARTLWVKPVPVRKKRINRDRHRHLVESIAAIMHQGREQGAPSHFTYEASCRHGLRSSLCLQGWDWQDADAIAAEIVAAALNRIGARRPTWNEGQPEWTQPGILALARSRCIRCGTKLPEGHFKFCSDLCGTAFNQAKARQLDAEGSRARDAAYRAAWSAKQPKRECVECGEPFRPNKPGQRYCGKTCVARVARQFSRW